MQHEPNDKDIQVEAQLAELREVGSQDEQTLPNLIVLLIAIAEVMVGVTEKGSSNSSYWVDRFLRSVKLGPGHPWCLAFVQWIYAEACDILGLPDILSNDTGGTRALWNWASLRGLVTTDYMMLSPGDILIWSDGSKVTGHCALITERSVFGGLPVLHTIEGNIGNGSWRDGGSVDFREYTEEELRLRKPSSTKRWCRGAVQIEKLYQHAGIVPETRPLPPEIKTYDQLAALPAPLLPDATATPSANTEVGNDGTA